MRIHFASHYDSHLFNYSGEMKIVRFPGFSREKRKRQSRLYPIIGDASGRFTHF